MISECLLSNFLPLLICNRLIREGYKAGNNEVRKLIVKLRGEKLCKNLSFLIS